VRVAFKGFDITGTEPVGLFRVHFYLQSATGQGQGSSWSSGSSTVMMEEVVKQDIPSVSNVLHNLKTHLDMSSSVAKGLQTKLDGGELKTEKGISFLETKNHLMLSYLTNLTYVMLRKTRGLSLVGEEAIKRLVEIRTVMERMRPIEKKLQYQVDKIIRNASGKTEDPLRFRANPDNLASREEDSEILDEKGRKKSAAYVPPKLTPMICDIDETEEDRKKVLLERARKRALSGSIMSELRREFDTAPEEIRESGHHTFKLDQKDEQKDLREYEEEFYKRVKITNKNRSLARKPQTSTNLSNIAQFEDMRILYDMDARLDELADASASKKAKKDKTPRKGKGKGKIKGKARKFKKKMK